MYDIVYIYIEREGILRKTNPCAHNLGCAHRIVRKGAVRRGCVRDCFMRLCPGIVRRDCAHGLSAFSGCSPTRLKSDGLARWTLSVHL